ncbi:MAG: GumC family protein [Dongiaceae bacterium]
MAVMELERPTDYLAAFGRRKWLVLLVTLSLASLALLVATFWPPIYRSSATILIEEPDVPSDLVRSTVSTFADERLQMIEQRVMTTQNLIGIIDKFGLYESERKTEPMAVVVEDMRDMIDLGVVSADVNDPHSGRTTRATIAFTVSFDSNAPRTAQQVANELVTLYLSENLRTRQEQAAGTTGFLHEESSRLAGRIEELETQLAAFKAKYAGSLPEQLTINTQILDRTQSDMLEIRRQLQAAQERQIFLQAQLAQVDPYSTTSVTFDGKPLLSAADRLRALEMQFLSISATYGPNHPDVKKLKREIDGLKGAAGGGSDAVALQERRQAISSELAQMQEEHGAEHPDVKRLQRELSNVEAAIAEGANSAGVAAASPERPNNPAYIQLQAQVNAAEADIAALKGQSIVVEAKLTAIEQRVMQTPEVERAYLEMKRDYDQTVQKYQEVRQKEGEARLAENLEAESKGEKFSVIEPPALPEEPVRPNRKLILLVGFALAMAAGVGSGALADSIDDRVYGQRQLAGLSGQPPLVVIPRVRNAGERNRVWALWILGVLAVVAGIVAALAYVHFMVMPLDVAFAMLAERFKLRF